MQSLDAKNWELIRKLAKEAFKSSFYYSIATVDSEGHPHVTPIGSLFLRKNFTGFYLEHFLVNMPKNLEINQRVCILFVNSGRKYWLTSLFKGRYISPPAVRLYGKVSERRKAEEDEIALFHHRVKPLKKFKGYKILWKNFKFARDIQFDSFEPVRAGEMTKDIWMHS